MCGLNRESCGGSNVTSVQCEGFADRCMTVSIKLGSNTRIMKYCAHSTLSCQVQSQYNRKYTLGLYRAVLHRVSKVIALVLHCYAL